MRRLLSLGVLCVSFSSFAAENRVELKLEKAAFGKGIEEISGLTIVAGQTFIVSDEPTDTFLYGVTYQGRRFSLDRKIKLKAFAGFNEVSKSFAKIPGLAIPDQRFDLEGIVACGNLFYLANERARQILVVDKVRKTIVIAPIDFSKITDLFGGGGNAGFEGLAVDCAKKKLYVAKERSPRGIITVDLTTWQASALTDFPGSDRTGQKTIEFKTGAGLMELTTDIGDLAFDNGFLYVLERNSYEVTKLNPDTLQVVDRVSYFLSTKDTYDSEEPFGKAEALHLIKDTIIIADDNNGEPLGTRTMKKYGVKGSSGAIYFFKRPVGF